MKMRERKWKKEGARQREWEKLRIKQQQCSLLRPEEFMDLHHVFYPPSVPSHHPWLSSPESPVCLLEWPVIGWVMYLHQRFFVLQGFPAAPSLVRPDLLLTNKPQHLLTFCFTQKYSPYLLFCHTRGVAPVDIQQEKQFNEGSWDVV